MALAVAHTWPLASDLAHLSRLDNADAALNTWAVSWVAHAVVHQPMRLFEAPIFYPEQHTLAYSEHLIVPALMGAPLSWAGVSAVAVHNLLFILGMALSGWAMCLVMRRWTNSWPAAIVAGLAYGFNAHVLARFTHLQAQHVEFFPLVLLAIDRVLEKRGARDAALLAIAFVLQSLCSNYMLAFTLLAMIAFVLARPGDLLGADRVRVLTLLAAAGVASVVLLAPFLLPYYQVSRDQGLAWSLDEVREYSAGWRDYLGTGARLHYDAWSAPYFTGHTPLFPGVTAFLLAVAGVMTGRGMREPKIRAALIFGIGGILLSLGPSLPGYALLHAYVPLIGGLRAAARWGWLALAAVSILAGYGTAAITARAPKWSMAITIAFGVLLTAEALRAPVGLTPFDRIPAIYDRLATPEPKVVVEFPIYGGSGYHLNGPYLLANTRYFAPLVNGYSSFQPNTYIMRAERLRSFPEPGALALMKELGVTHVVVHVDRFRHDFGQGAFDAIAGVPGLVLEHDEDGIRIYRFES